MHTISENRLFLLRPSDILLSPDRTRRQFDEYELRTLASSILSCGMIEPLVVRREGRDKYILISGERRLKAARTAGIRRLPCVVHEVDCRTAAIYSAAANVCRKDLDIFETAESVDRLIGIYGIGRTEIARSLGMPGAALEGKLKLLRIPADMRESILTANLCESQALELLKLDKKDMSLVLDAVIGEALNARQTRELVKSVTSPEREPLKHTAPNQAPPTRKSAIGDLNMFSNSLTKLLVTLRDSGIGTSLERKETDGFIEYKIRLDKRKEKQLALSI